MIFYDPIVSWTFCFNFVNINGIASCYLNNYLGPGGGY